MSKSASSADHSSVAPLEARQLFAYWKSAPAIVVAVSGGPDSTALLYLLARWRKALKKGPALVAVTVDHRLRAESAGEARAVAKLASSLGVTHRTLRWNGAKPKTGLQAAAREARYALLAQAAKRAGATLIMTAHSRDDQAETVLMRLSRGSGIAGLGGMARETPLLFSKSRSDGRFSPPSAKPSSSPLPSRERSRAKRAGEGAEPIVLARPLLDIPKTRLIATLEKAGIDFADDVSNSDPRFTRVRWRGLMPSLSDEGLDSRALARLARRAGRAEAALDHVTLGIGRLLVRRASDGRERLECQRAAFVALPDEIRLRLLGGMIAAVGGEGPPELGKLETMLDMVNGILVSGDRLRRSLAGAIVAVETSRIAVEKAPPRRPVTKRS